MTDKNLAAQGSKLRIASQLAAVAAVLAVTGTTVTATAAAHGQEPGDRIRVGTETFTVVSAPTADTFTYTDANAVAGNATFTPMLVIDAKSFDGPGGSASVIDCTTLASKAKEKRAGLMDEGNISITVNYANHVPALDALRAARAARAVAAMELEFSDGVIWAFDALVLQFAVSGAVDGLVEGKVQVDITGPVTQLV